MIWPIQQRLLLEDATPRNLIIGKNIAGDCLDTNIFKDGRGYHLHVIGELLELLQLFAFGEDRFDESEVVAGLELLWQEPQQLLGELCVRRLPGHGEGCPADARRWCPRTHSPCSTR